MSGDYFERHYDDLKHLMQPYKSRVFFGDRTTCANITQCVNINVQYVVNDKPHDALCKFLILPGKGRDLIIGTPSLFTHFGHVFLSLISDAVTRLGGSVEAVDDERTMSSMAYKHVTPPEGAVYPWTTDVNCDAPEDGDIPEALSFNDTVLS